MQGRLIAGLRRVFVDKERFRAFLHHDKGMGVGFALHGPERAMQGRGCFHPFRHVKKGAASPERRVHRRKLSFIRLHRFRHEMLLYQFRVLTDGGVHVGEDDALFL